MDLNVKVAVRCRPMSSKEIARGCNNIIEINDKKITINGIDAQHEQKDFTFDYCYGPDSLQATVFSDLGKPIVQQALDGFNGTIFAYGQTGSGKSFSMMGNDTDMKGIIPHLNEDLFTTLNQKLNDLQKKSAIENNNAKIKFMVTVSFLEVYNEEIKDLLNPSDKKLKIREDPKLGIYVEDLYELVARDYNDVMKLIYQGNAVRRVAATKMNEESSRSHSVFTIKIEQQTITELANGVTREQTIKAKLNLVDLAGSERASKTGASGQTLKEGANINLSLMTLGNVINMLSEGKGRKNRVIPYRDSKLTRLLQESLGGNAATVMLAAISPADYNYSETLSTLKYANRAKSIANAITRNEDSNERMIRDLQSQIEELKRKLEQGIGSGGHDNTLEHENNEELEKKLKEMEANQLNAFEEKERLSKALELERQSNMNNVISEMMHTVKEQKVLHMKNIKRLTNEKTLLQRTMKDSKDSNIALKSSLDVHIHEYQDLQKLYDAAATSMNEIEGENEEETTRLKAEKHKEADKIATQMITLLQTIEEDRLKYTEQRAALKEMKSRFDTIEIEITDERAELVTTTGILNQNDKLREQIQIEEREKMKIEFEQEMNKHKIQLDLERQNVRDTISSEIENEMLDLRNEIIRLKKLLLDEQQKCIEYAQQEKLGQEYAEELEQRLADSELEVEESHEIQLKLNEENQLLKHKIEELYKHEDDLRNEYDEMEDSLRNELDKVNTEKINHEKMIKDAEFEIFTKIMNVCEKEQKELINIYEKEKQDLINKYMNSQDQLKRAVQDIEYLSKALEKAMHYEPVIR